MGIHNKIFKRAKSLGEHYFHFHILPLFYPVSDTQNWIYLSKIARHTAGFHPEPSLTLCSVPTGQAMPYWPSLTLSVPASVVTTPRWRKQGTTVWTKSCDLFGSLLLCFPHCPPSQNSPTPLWDHTRVKILPLVCVARILCGARLPGVYVLSLLSRFSVLPL